MKYLIIFLFPFISFSQTDTCFTEQEVLDISFTLDSLTELNNINQRIIREQGYIIDDLKHLTALDSVQLKYYAKQTEALNKNIDAYIEREKYIKPKWYDNKVIWFTGGIVSTVITTKLIVQIVK